MTDAFHHLEKAELERRDQRKFSYHLLGSKNKLPANPDDEYDDPLFQHLTSSSSSSLTKNHKSNKVTQAKVALLRELAQSGGDATTPTFLDALEELSSLYDPDTFDARELPQHAGECTTPGTERNKTSPELEGMWISLSKPIFESSLGNNSQGDPLFSLGRMSFGMYHPADLVCSIQGTFNSLHVVPPEERDAALKHVPKSLEAELRQDKTLLLRSYNIMTAFTIEPSTETAVNAMVTHPMEGLMTTRGFVISNPDNGNRLTVYFDSGTLEVGEDESRDLGLWKTIFAEHAATTSSSRATTSTKRKRRWMFGSRILHRRHPQPQKEQDTTSTGSTSAPLVTMEEDGRMSYQLQEPVGGHETAYLDMLYLDETLRICRSNSGTVYVFARVCGFEYD